MKSLTASMPSFEYRDIELIHTDNGDLGIFQNHLKLNQNYQHLIVPINCRVYDLISIKQFATIFHKNLNTITLQSQNTKQ